MCFNQITFARIPWNFMAFSKQWKPHSSPCARLWNTFTILLLIPIDLYLLSPANERSCGFASSKQCSVTSNTTLYTVQSLDISTHTLQRHLETYERYRVMTIMIMIIDIYSYFVYLILETDSLSCVPSTHISTVSKYTMPLAYRTR